MTSDRRTVLLCDCAHSMSIDVDRVRAALPDAEIGPVRTTLCRNDTEAYLSALRAGGEVVVACTPEAPLFRELAEEAGADDRVSFVNIREKAGWCADKAAAGPKMAALLAEATVAPAPAAIHTTRSEGMCLVYGRGQQALEVAQSLNGRLAVSLLMTDADGMVPPSVADVPVYRGRIVKAAGSFGAFEITVDGYAPLVPSSREAAAFVMPRDGAQSQCDVILDLSGDTALFPAPDHRDGYFRVDPNHPAAVAKAMFEITDYVGEFEKPVYVDYDADICVHSRNRIVGCTNCLDACPEGAISDMGDTIAVDPGICGGCGSCSASCPTGAVSYRYPRREDLIARIQVLVSTYLAAGGTRPVLLFHDARRGAELIAAMARFGRGLPVNVLPVPLHAVTELGHDILAAAFVTGVEQMVALVDPARADEVLPLETQGTLVRSILQGLGHDADRMTILVEADPDAVETALYGLAERTPLPAAGVAAVGGKRDIGRAAIGRLHETAPQRPDVIALPDGAPYGRIVVDQDSCTLCLACVGACPMGAILDNPDKPQLRFQENACVQCGICRNTCPEDAITLEARFDFTPNALSQTVIHEEEPYACLRCGKPFGTKKTVDRIVEQLQGKHWMFQSSATADLIRMCDDCRVIAQSEMGDNPFKMGERPKVRTTDDYLEAREAGKDLTVDDFLDD